MKKLFLTVALFMTALLLCGAPLQVVSNGKSTYSIAWCDKVSPNLQREYQNVARLMQRVIQTRTGARLPIVKASELKQGGKAIFVGAPVKPGAWKLNEYAITANANGNILLSGDDFDAVPKARRGDHELRIGSVKAAVEFLKKFAGADFLYPGFEGIYIPKSPELTVPEKYFFKEIPYLQFAIGRSAELYYAFANSKFSAPWYCCHGGHSHIPAIPPAKYLKPHLEYFAIVNGKRNGYPSIPQYCLSNPEVQKLIYQRILDDVDQPGVIETQLAQTDGFRKCECPGCKKLLGDDPGEALWKMHLGMAERLLKDRPGKRVRIIAYGPTKNPPKFCKKFPANVSVTIAIGRKLTEKYFSQWKDYTVPYGFDVYLYNWGEYQTEGMTPTFNLTQARQQADFLRENKINALYFCGFMELPGLCCPVNTYYLRAMNGDKTAPGRFLKDYCTKVFGDKAGAAMNDFYTLLYSRVDIAPSAESDYTLTQKSAAKKSIFAPNVAILHKRYPEEILAKLEKGLAAAEKNAPGNFMLKRTRREFDYLKLTAGACNDFYAYHADPSQANFERLAQRIIDRKKFIEALPMLSNGHYADYTHLPVFGYMTKGLMLDNGRLGGKMGAPFIWDVEYYLAHKIRPSGRVLKADGKDFQQMLDVFADKTVKPIKEFPAFVGCRYDDQNFYAIFRFPKAKEQIVKHNCYFKFQRNDSSPCIKLWRIGEGPLYGVVRTKTSAENKNLEEVWKNMDREWLKKYPAKMTWSPYDPARGAEAVMTIPWGLLGGKPKAGERAKINFFFWPDRTAYCWEYDINLLNWHHRFNGIGTVEF